MEPIKNDLFYSRLPVNEISLSDLLTEDHLFYQNAIQKNQSMPGESDLNIILKTLKPFLHDGEYVFCQVPDQYPVDLNDIISYFKEAEGVTIILSKLTADRFKLPYSIISAWITLTVHSSLESVGLTAAFSNALASAGISCNVVAACFHDHIFVDMKDAQKAMKILEDFSK